MKNALLLHPQAREYLHIPLIEAPHGATDFSVSVDGWDWITATVETENVTFLVSGPDAQEHPDTLVLNKGVNHILVRVNIGDEIVIRQAATLVVSE